MAAVDAADARGRHAEDQPVVSLLTSAVTIAEFQLRRMLTRSRLAVAAIGILFPAAVVAAVGRTAGFPIERDLAALLTNLQPHDVLFIDEIHRLSPAVEEILYPAMEDFHLDLIIGEGPAARSVRIDLPPFTLVGATTRSGLLTTPLRERFGIPLRLNFYDTADLVLIVSRGARILSVPLTDEGSMEIARRSRGTPRIAGRLLRRVRDFAAVAGHDRIDRVVASEALRRLEVDERGLDAMDRRYLSCIAESFGGGPVGIETMAAALSEPRDAIEEIVEPFLIQEGLLQRTPRGRQLTAAAFAHLGLAAPSVTSRQLEMPVSEDDDG